MIPVALTPLQASAGLSGAALWNADADAPDVLDLRDFAGRPDLAASAVTSRRNEHTVIGRPRRFDYPKPTGAMRHLTWLDPLAQLDLRLVVGAAVSAIERGAGPEVRRFRTTGSGASWRTEPWRDAYRSFGEAMDEHRADSATRFEVLLDVESFYPSVGTEAVQRALSSLGVDDAVEVPICEWLDALHGRPGAHPGLPVAIESSGPLSTAALTTLDRVIRDAGFPFLRWVDDYRVYTPSEAAADAAIQAAAEHLALSGLALDSDKTDVRPITPGMRGAGVSDGADESSGPPQRLLTLAVGREPEGMTRSLGFLRHLSDPSGVGVILDYPWVIDRFPKESTMYLGTVWGAVGPEDRARLADRLLEPTTSANAPAQLFLARLLRRTRVSSATGEAVFSRGLGLDVHQFGPTKAHYFALAGSSRENPRHRRTRALELADTITDLDLKRALLTGLRGDGEVAASVKVGLRHLVGNDPELAAAAHWATAA